MNPCAERSLVDAHFQGTIATTDERAMREHLVVCERCRRRYEKRLLLAKLDPEALSSEERIGRGLGLVAPAAARPPKAERRSSRSRSWAIAASALAMAAAIVIFLRSRGPAHDDFSARGALPAAEDSALTVYRVAGSTPTRAATSIGRRDELAFAYRNVDAKPYLLVFGVDEQRRVYWFFPAWTNATENPSAIRIETDRAAHELKEAIRHPFAGDRLAIHAIFLERPLTVRDLEAALAGSGTEKGLRTAPLELEGAVDHVTVLGLEGGEGGGEP